MILGFDIGNTDIYGGVHDGTTLRMEFRRSNQHRPSADEFGVFLVTLLQARGLRPEDIDRVAIASVVPDSLPSVVGACRTFLRRNPLVLEAGIKTGLKLRIHNPAELGADRVANAIAAVERFPGRDLIVVDMGTATTFCAINLDREYLGGVIAAGMGLSMHALGRGTAKLPQVDVTIPTACLGKNTIEHIQSGLYFGHIGLLREVVARFTTEAFEGRRPLVIGTGGFARLFREARVFDHYLPSLVLDGLIRALELNPQHPHAWETGGNL